MYIRPHKDGYRVEVEKNGFRASHVARTKREATAWGIRKEAELEAMKASKGRTFGWARAHYVETVSKTKSEGAADWEDRRLTAMAVFFGDDTMLAVIDSERIGQWRDYRLKTVSGSTVQREANLLRNLFTLAVNEWRCMERNPFKGVRLPDHAPARHQVWTWPLIKRVLRAKRSGKTLEVIRAFHVALHTGMRLSEVLAARVEGRVALLPKDKTTKGPVKVPLARHGAELLARYSPFTVGQNEASTLFSDLCRELLIDGLTFHDSRASALTWLSRRMDVMTLARISRHKDLRILMDSYYRETAEQIAARLQK
jgi:integrase